MGYNLPLENDHFPDGKYEIISAKPSIVKIVT